MVAGIGYHATYGGAAPSGGVSGQGSGGVSGQGSGGGSGGSQGSSIQNPSFSPSAQGQQAEGQQAMGYLPAPVQGTSDVLVGTGYSYQSISSGLPNYVAPNSEAYYEATSEPLPINTQPAVNEASPSDLGNPKYQSVSSGEPNYVAPSSDQFKKLTA